MNRIALTLQVRIVTPDYFKTMGIPVVKGRGFAAGDRLGSQPVAMLNETGAARVWPDQDALGHQLEIGTRFGHGRRSRAAARWSASPAMFATTVPRRRVPPTLYLAARAVARRRA